MDQKRGQKKSDSLFFAIPTESIVYVTVLIVILFGGSLGGYFLVRRNKSNNQGNISCEDLDCQKDDSVQELNIGGDTAKLYKKEKSLVYDRYEFDDMGEYILVESYNLDLTEFAIYARPEALNDNDPLYSLKINKTWRTENGFILELFEKWHGTLTGHPNIYHNTSFILFEFENEALSLLESWQGHNIYGTQQLDDDSLVVLHGHCATGQQVLTIIDLKGLTTKEILKTNSTLQSWYFFSDKSYMYVVDGEIFYSENLDEEPQLIQRVDS